LSRSVAEVAGTATSMLQVSICPGAVTGDESRVLLSVKASGCTVWVVQLWRVGAPVAVVVSQFWIDEPMATGTPSRPRPFVGMPAWTRIEVEKAAGTVPKSKQIWSVLAGAVAVQFAAPLTG